MRDQQFLIIFRSRLDQLDALGLEFRDCNFPEDKIDPPLDLVKRGFARHLDLPSDQTIGCEHPERHLSPVGLD